MIHGRGPFCGPGNSRPPLHCHREACEAGRRDLVSLQGALDRHQIATGPVEMAGLSAPQVRPRLLNRALAMTVGRGRSRAHLFQHNRLLSRVFRYLMIIVILNEVKDP